MALVGRHERLSAERALGARHDQSDRRPARRPARRGAETGREGRAELAGGHGRHQARARGARSRPGSPTPARRAPPSSPPCGAIPTRRRVRAPSPRSACRTGSRSARVVAPANDGPGRVTAGQLLRRVLAAGGIGTVYGLPLMGVPVTEVSDPAVAVLLAQAHRAVHGVAAAAHVGDGTLVVPGPRPGGVGDAADMVVVEDVETLRGAGAAGGRAGSWRRHPAAGAARPRAACSRRPGATVAPGGLGRARGGAPTRCGTGGPGGGAGRARCRGAPGCGRVACARGDRAPRRPQHVGCQGRVPLAEQAPLGDRRVAGARLRAGRNSGGRPGPRGGRG